MKRKHAYYIYCLRGRSRVFVRKVFSQTAAVRALRQHQQDNPTRLFALFWEPIATLP
jgi:hypothetical protein